SATTTPGSVRTARADGSPSLVRCAHSVRASRSCSGGRAEPAPPSRSYFSANSRAGRLRRRRRPLAWRGALMSQVPVYFLLSLPLVAAFAMFALGVVAIHQASRVLNLAHGAMAMVPAYVVFELSAHGVPLIAALVIGILSGALLGVAMERVFIRTLRGHGPTAQTVGTVAALGVLVSLSAKTLGTTPRVAVNVFPEGGIHVGYSLLRYGQIGLFFVAVVVSVGFFALFRYTDIGLA